MGRKGQVIIGPAGSGKSTYCSAMAQHLEASKRRVKVLNLDPAAEYFDYAPTVDVRDLISLSDVVDELQYGPNGGLVFCMEYLVENLDWLDEALGLDHVMDPDDYWLIDCPGQIELYTHFPVMSTLVQHLVRKGFTLCAVYCVEGTYISDAFKFFSGCLSAMSAMIQLDIPHVNVLTKMDLLKDAVSESRLDRFLWPDPSLMDEWALSEGKNSSEKWKLLNQAVTQLIDSYGMVAFMPLDLTNEDSFANVLLQIDIAVQYGEDLEPQDIHDDEIED